MKKVLFPLLAVALLLGAVGMFAAPAAAPSHLKPVAVLTVAGYDALKADVAFVGKLADQPEVAENLEGALKLITGGKGLAGLDKSRPIGAVIQTDGQEITGYGFLPVTDLKALVGVLEPYAEKIEELDGGVYKIVGKGGRGDTIYVQAGSDGWAFVAKKRELLEQAPANPTALTRDLAGEYDIAVRVYTANIPEKFRRKAVDDLKAKAEKDLERRSGESDEEFALRKKLSEEFFSSVVAVAKDLEQVTLGWTLDQEKGKTFLDVNIVAQRDSDTARAAASLKSAKTCFGGFRLPQAAFSGNWTGKMPERKIELLGAVVQAVRDKAMTDINKGDKPEAEKEAARKLAGEIFDVAAATVKSGAVDGGMAVLVSPESLTALVGGRVAETGKLDKVARQLTEIVRGQNPIVGDWIKLGAETCEGIEFHTVTIPVPDDANDRAKIVSLIGEKLEVVVGLGKESMYVAAGRNALSTLKEAIEKSAAEASQTVPPIRLSLAVKPVAEFVAEVGEAKDRPKAARVAKELADAAGRDHITLVASSIPDGVRYRLELEEGLVRLIGRLRDIQSQQ
jgi:hypothetical protein